jgi:hypothetical protein
MNPSADRHAAEKMPGVSASGSPSREGKLSATRETVVDLYGRTAAAIAEETADHNGSEARGIHFAAATGRSR